MSYGSQNEKTEVYMALWSYQSSKSDFGWTGMGLSSDLSIEQIARDPMKAQSGSMPDSNPKWISIENQIKENTLSVKAGRNFNKAGTDRDLKLGQTRKWAIGFLDMGMSGTAPF